MDTTQTTHLSLCSGYGGIDLGLRRAIPNLRTVAYAEIEAFAIENLLARMEGGALDPAPVWPDLKTFPWGAFSDRVDILSGGYPCQPFSAAGKRLGGEDPRHLWPFISDGIRLLRPKFCFFENVEGHITLGLREVIGDLERLGYRSTWGIFSASEVGAPHQRKRVFILAHRNNQRLQRQSREFVGHNNDDLADSNNSGSGEDQLPSGLRTIGVEQSSRCSRLPSESTQVGKVAVWPSCPHESQDGIPHSKNNGLEKQSECSIQSNQSGRRDGNIGGVYPRFWPSRPGEPQHEWEPPRVVGNTESRQDDGREPGDMGTAPSQGRCSDDAADGTGEGLGDASRELLNGSGSGAGEDRCAKPANAGQWQAQPSLGGDADGPTRGLDYAELCVSGDNRTDELRLLGNGVVPATATLAFRTLLQEIISA